MAFVGQVGVLSGLAVGRTGARRNVSSRRRAVLRATAASIPATTLAVDKGSKQNPFKIAVLPGDGAGPAVTEATLKVLQALADYTELHFAFSQGLFGEQALAEAGSEVPSETIELCKDSDAVLRSYQGFSRGSVEHGAASVTGHVKLSEALGIFAQLRPLKVFPELISESPLTSNLVEGLDLILVREVAGGALRLSDDKMGETSSSQTISYDESEVSRIAAVALKIAEARNGKIHNVDKADRMSVSSFWRAKMHEHIEANTVGRSDIRLRDVYVDDFCREFIVRPKQFDVVVTSNLFGDMIAEVMSAVSGPMRISPSAWYSKEGTWVFGPADIFNSTVYRGQSEVSTNPIAMVRSASMMLRYGLNQPAAADLLLKAVSKTLAEISSDEWGDRPVDAANVSDAMIRALEYMHTYEMVCSDVDECGE